MRAVVILFAEARELLPRTSPVYDESYGLNGLFNQLERNAAIGDGMADIYGAWPRILALCRLVSEGSHHPDLPVHAYGGELFAPGQRDSDDGVSRALHVFETACLGADVLADRDVHTMLRLLTRTKAKIRQGRSGMWVTVPVDFSDLSSEYIGIVYEGLLDYELKTAPAGDPVVFLAAGDRPALYLCLAWRRWTTRRFAACSRSSRRTSPRMRARRTRTSRMQHRRKLKTSPRG